MIARSTTCFRNGKKGRDPICSSGDSISLANTVQNHVTWGKITSRKHPPAGVFEEWARKLNTSVATVRRMWEKGIL